MKRRVIKKWKNQRRRQLILDHDEVATSHVGLATRPFVTLMKINWAISLGYWPKNRPWISNSQGDK